MKKKVLASLLCASMVATMFAGCGSSNGNGTEKADKKAGGKETITVMGPRRQSGGNPRPCFPDSRNTGTSW